MHRKWFCSSKLPSDIKIDQMHLVPWPSQKADCARKYPRFVEQCLAPILKRKDIVMIDNLPAHKAAGIREAIEARGATLRYLPQYSPDLNPIEMPFSKLKASLRK